MYLVVVVDYFVAVVYIRYMYVLQNQKQNKKKLEWTQMYGKR
jgi:hypothetical protein